MAKLEKLLLVCVLGAFAPIAGFLAGWWGSFKFLPENFVFFAAVVGLVLGLVIDALFLKKWVTNAYQMDLNIWMALYIFYAVGLFGFFMGVPVFNLLLAVPAGFLMGRRLVRTNASAEDFRRMARRTQVFTTAVLGVACLASAVIALHDPSTGANLQGMLGLGFEMTMLMIWGIILIGGGMLLALQWVLTHAAVRMAVKPGA